MTKIDLTPLQQAADTERRLAHKRIEALEAELFWWRAATLVVGAAILVGALL